MTAHRISVKYFLTDPAAVALPAFVPVFHRWIQEQRLDEVLIDVADYKHVHEGPGILLIGHEGDFAVDQYGGRAGLLYVRKRQTDGDLHSVLRTALHQALHGCLLLENEPSLAGRVRFRTDELEIAFVDRLRVPNRRESLELMREALAAALADVYGDLDVEPAWVDRDARRPFTVRISVPDAPEVAALVGRLERLTENLPD